MTPPLFSIVTVARNAANTIQATLDSVKSQTCRDFEYLLIDGASTDDTVRLAEKSGIEGMRVLSEPDNGIYDAMNKGLGMATGEYVIFLNAGDAFHAPGTLQQYADAARNDSRPGVIYGQTQLVDAQRNRVADRHLRAPEQLTLQSFGHGMVVCHQAFAALRKLTSTFDTTYRYSSDYDWCVRCLQHSRHNHYIDDIVIDYLNEGVTTANHRRSLIERFKIMCRYYGTMTTVLRHVAFLGRHLHRRLTNRNMKQ